MITFRISSIVCILVFITGCTAPVVKGDSVQNQKQLSFPKVGTQATVQIGGLAVLHSDYRSRHIFKLVKPFNMSVMLVNRIAVSTDEQLVESEIDGQTIYCTENNTYFDALTGPMAKACFKTSTRGKFSSVTYRPGAIWFSKEISPEVDYVSRELQVQGQITPLKRELIFDGSQDGVLMFSERIYETSLETPSRIKPLIATIPSLPLKVTLDGMDINVVRLEANKLTFEVVNPWR